MWQILGRIVPWLLASTLFGCMTAVVAAPLSTAFTYQGELFDGGVPAVGSYDLRFTPYADASNPGLLGPPLVVQDVLVSNGIFTTQVDFGPGFFVGDAVFLEVAVRPFDSDDPSAFEPLTPRQEITAAPYALRPAPGSVTDIELAGDAVGSAQVADNSVTSNDLADGSIAPQDLNLGSATFDTTFWRVGGNAGAGSLGIGTLDNQLLRLFSPIGVVVNGPAFNTNTELTVRGNSSTVETNADLMLWPRAGEAFFNIAVIGATPADTRLVFHAVGTNPFTGYFPRAQMNFDGSFGIGGADPAPQARLHVTGVDQGFDVPADSIEALELVIEDNDAQIGLYSAGGGSVGSVIGLAEMGAGAVVDQWGLLRTTQAAGSSLRFTYGSDITPALNPTLFNFGANASLAIGDFAPNQDTEVFVTGSSTSAGTAVDLSLRPRGGDHLFNLSVDGTSATDTRASLQFAGSSANYIPRFTVTGTGSLGAGKSFALAHGGSFVFADDSTAAALSTTATNQFLVRAVNGFGLNGAPLQSSYELNVQGRTVGESADFALRSGGSTTSYLQTSAGTDSSDASWRLLQRDAPGGIAFISRLWFGANGFLGISAGFSTPAFPLLVGTNTSNGNGARLTTGGVWTNGSSRTFKEAFTAIDVGQVLDRVLDMPITRWRYRGGEDAWHLGPVAEDFRAAFGLGESEKYIGTVDADGVALAAIQGLHARSEARAEALQHENEVLRQALDALAQRVDALEHGH